MRSRTSVLTSSLAFLYFVGIVGRSALAMEETPASSMNLQHYNNMLSSMAFDDTVPEKRAYTYVSEYKRLPVYNFGIGKRWIDTNDNKVRISGLLKSLYPLWSHSSITILKPENMRSTVYFNFQYFSFFVKIIFTCILFVRIIRI